MLLSYYFAMTAKKLLMKICGWIVAIVLVIGFFHVYDVITDTSYKLKPGEKFQEVSGKSMGEKFPDGIIIVDTLANPSIGDVISFECLVDKCDKVVTNHRLVGIDSNGCMSIVGDNQNASWDTNDYGCLMPDEIKILGVVIDKYLCEQN